MLVENEERSVRFGYVSTYNVFAENIHRKHKPSVALHLRRRIRFSAHHRHHSRVFEPPLPIKVQKLGFQDQEDGAILEIEERSVGNNYVSTADFGSAPSSTPNTLQRPTSSS